MSVGPSVGPSHFAFFAFSSILSVGKFVFEHALAQIITAPVSSCVTETKKNCLFSDPGCVVYLRLLLCSRIIYAIMFVDWHVIAILYAG